MKLKNLKVDKRASLKNLLLEGFRAMKQHGTDGFEYTIGEFEGGTISISYDPPSVPGNCTDSIMMDRRDTSRAPIIKGVG